MSFRKYLEHGWKLCAINPGSKGPTGAAAKGWNTRDKAISDPARGPGLAGAGLCHAWSGTCAIDIDNHEVARAYLADRGVDLDALLLDPASVQIDSGRPGRGKLLYALPTPLASLKLATYRTTDHVTAKPKTYHGLELRCATSEGLTVQDVLPETIHPETGRAYAWKYGDSLFGTWQNLPALPQSLLTLWQSELSPVTSDVGTAPPAAHHRTGGAAFSELAELIETEDPDTDYDTWIDVGLGLHYETAGAGLDIWDAWSSRGQKYKGRRDLETHWASFRIDAKNPKTLGWLRAKAIAKPEAFPLTTAPVAAAPDVGMDTRPSEVVKQILETKLVFVAGQDRYYNMDAKAEAWLSDRSVRHLFCPLMPTIVKPGKDGQPDRVVTPDPVEHLKFSKTKLVVDAVGLHPGEKRLFNEDDRRYVNRYTPRVIEPLRPKPHELEAFNFLWSRILDPVVQQWLLKFFAHAVQKPGVKMQTAPLLFSAAQGTGKNTIAKLIPELLFGSQWVRTMSGNVLGGQFNDVIGETWWLYLEELRSGATKVDRVMTANKIKSWVTDSSIEVHPKGLKPYDIRNRLQITATSNFDDALQIDNNDRRWVIGELGDPLTEQEAQDLYAFLNGPRAPGVLHHIFRSIDLTGFQPTGRAPSSAAKVVMISAGLGSWESMLLERMVNLEPPFDRDVFTLQDVHEQLLGRGPTNLHQLRKVLQRHPFSCSKLNKTATKRHWAWRNADQWRRFSEGDRTRYIETGARPAGHSWSSEIPAALLSMSADSEDDPAENPCDGLL